MLPQKLLTIGQLVLQYYVATMIDNRIPGVAAVAQTKSGRALKSIKERMVGKVWKSKRKFNG